MKRALAVALLALVLPAAARAWGGSYPTGDAFDSSVTIQVADTYPVDPALPQSWAAFLGSLVHGPEVARLVLDLQPIEAITQICGSRALACYDPRAQTIHASPDDVTGQPPAREVVMHEYGHHVASNRSDAPWPAVAFGTKRWSSYENICARTADGTAAPGDEGSRYSLNPGEAFAESYRVLNLTRQGATSIDWRVVDRSFYPDATALQLLEADVASPWTGNTAKRLRGSFGGGGVRTFTVGTPLDGTFTARLTKPTKATMRLALYAGSRLLMRGQRVSYQICGARTLTLKVERVRGRGAFSIDVSKP